MIAKGRVKLRKMKACLGEAARKMTIACLNLICNLEVWTGSSLTVYFFMGNLFCCVHLRMDSESISLMQDASAGWLCIRYGSCCESLTPNAGVLGVYNIAELLQTHAKKISEATQKILCEFACPSSRMPYSKQERFLERFCHNFPMFSNRFHCGLILWQQRQCSCSMATPLILGPSILALRRYWRLRLNV
jgi:hypothetical protein